MRGHWQAFLAALIWSGSFVSIRILRQELGVYPMFVARWAPTAVLMVVIWLAFRPPAAERARVFTRRGWWWLLWLGVFAAPFYHLPLNYGAAQVSAGVLGVLIATVPVQSAALELLLRERRPSWRYLCGIGIAALGALVLVASRHGLTPTGAAVAPRGFWHAVAELRFPLAVLLSAFAGAAYSLISKRATREIDSLSAATLSVPVGVATVLWLLPGMAWAPFTRLSPNAWWALAYLVLAATVWAGILWVRAIQLLSPSQVTLYLYVTMLGSAVWGALFLGERLPLGFWPATACVMLGMHLVNRERLAAAAAASSAATVATGVAKR